MRKFFLSLLVLSVCSYTLYAENEAIPPHIDPETLEQEKIKEQDPLEPLNRLFFGIHKLIDGLIISPITLIYKTALPQPLQNGVHNFIGNLFEPINFGNFLLQGRFDEAGNSMMRFFANSTMGVLGVMDAGQSLGFKHNSTGFGDTLTTWGVQGGPYLFLPILTATDFRGGLGTVADYYTDPFNAYYRKGKHRKYRWQNHTRYGLYLLDMRKEKGDILDKLNKHSLDPYVTTRSFYLQNREKKEAELRKPGRRNA